MHEAPQAQDTHETGEKPPSFIAQPDSEAVHQSQPLPDVSAFLRSVEGERALSPAELEAHVQTCATLCLRAYARYCAHRKDADRDEAMLWLQRQNEAILSRSPEVQAQRHAAFELRLAGGVERVERVLPLRRRPG